MDWVAGAYAALADQPRGTWVLVAVLGAGVRIWLAVLLGGIEDQHIWVRRGLDGYGIVWGWLMLSGVSTDVWHTITDEHIWVKLPIPLAALIVVCGVWLLRDGLPEAARWFRNPG